MAAQVELDVVLGEDLSDGAVQPRLYVNEALPLATRAVHSLGRPPRARPGLVGGKEVRTRHVSGGRTRAGACGRRLAERPAGTTTGHFLVALVTAPGVACTQPEIRLCGTMRMRTSLDLASVDRAAKDRCVPADVHAARPHVRREGPPGPVVARDDRRVGGLGANECEPAQGDDREPVHRPQHRRTRVAKKPSARGKSAPNLRRRECGLSSRVAEGLPADERPADTRRGGGGQHLEPRARPGNARQQPLPGVALLGCRSRRFESHRRYQRRLLALRGTVAERYRGRRRGQHRARARMRGRFRRPSAGGGSCRCRARAGPGDAAGFRKLPFRDERDDVEVTAHQSAAATAMPRTAAVITPASSSPRAPTPIAMIDSPRAMMMMSP